MANVQRANVFLTIEDAEIPKYLAKGFNLLDASGKVIKKSAPTDIAQLQKAYAEHEEALAEKDAEIAKLRSEIQAMKSAGVSKTPAAVEAEEPEEDEGWDDWGDAEEVEDSKPHKNGKHKSKG